MQNLLSAKNKTFLEGLTSRFHFTREEKRLLTEWSRDLEMWREEGLETRCRRLTEQMSSVWDAPQRKHWLFDALRREIDQLKKEPKSYGENFAPRPVPPALKIKVAQSEKEIFGDCPVASPKTVCCNLKTIDAVENCGFGCSYCTIQTFYGDAVVFDQDFGKKLKALRLDSNRFYHIGTGQSSDSLLWGNRNGILDDLCEFAEAHPNILLELKTKSANIGYFLERKTPRNLVLSWSLNTDTIVNAEEHFTASLAKRLEAARKAADRGIRVAFHFHPMVYYQGWEEDYPGLARQIQRLFSPEEVIFISLGSVTLIKPVIREIRKKPHATKILQMELVPDPHGKLTYPDAVKIALFKGLYGAFQPWQESVYFYLCMERAEIWDVVFGWHYPTNELFESDFGAKTMPKLRAFSGVNEFIGLKIDDKKLILTRAGDSGRLPPQ